VAKKKSQTQKTWEILYGLKKKEMHFPVTVFYKCYDQVYILICFFIYWRYAATWLGHLYTNGLSICLLP